MSTIYTGKDIITYYTQISLVNNIAATSDMGIVEFSGQTLSQ